MTVVDEHGRLFGRVNMLDAAVGIVLVGVALMAFVGLRLLRVPTPPHVTAVVPSTLTAGPGLRVTLKGDNLLPYLRAYLQRTGQPAKAMTDPSHATSIDSYTLANFARGAFLVESPNLAELRLPEGLLSGTYDLILHNETRIVAVQPAAFTILPAPPPKPTANDPQASVRVTGAFTGLTREAAAALKPGSKLPHGAAEPWGEILSVKAPTLDSARLNFENARVMVKMQNRWQVPVELRIQCLVTQFKCWLPGGVIVAPGATISMDVAGTPVSFTVADVTSDPPERATHATVLVRFIMRPEVASLPREQDADTSPGGDRTDPARLVAIQHRAEVTGEVNEALADGNIRAPEKVTVLDGMLRVPLTSTEIGWVYRSQAIKAGAPITFQTDRYIMRGMIRSVTLPGPGAAATH